MNEGYHEWRIKMDTCKTCGGTVKKEKAGLYRCEYCGKTYFTTNDALKNVSFPEFKRAEVEKKETERKQTIEEKQSTERKQPTERVENKKFPIWGIIALVIIGTGMIVSNATQKTEHDTAAVAEKDLSIDREESSVNTETEESEKKKKYIFTPEKLFLFLSYGILSIPL